ncbi:MAG: prolyl oligopeptidase family serine peptidase, partial [Leadbetterella sp.]
GDDVYAITSRGTNFNKIICTSLKNPDWNNAKTVVEEKPEYILRNIRKLKDFLLITFYNGTDYALYKYHFESKKIMEIQLPFPTILGISQIDSESNIVYINLSSWKQPNTEFKLNVDTEKFTTSEFDKQPVLPKELENLVIKEIEVKAHDGKMIPLSIIHKKELQFDGKTTCLLTGYGAYGNGLKAVYNNMKISLAMDNVIIAIAHVRGGDERGQDWYKGGYKTTKPNTWKDFISCAEYLIAKKYTSSDKLFGEGTSAGGILISRAITERPDLFAAAICNVGCANAMRFEFSSNGQGNIPEFGTVKDKVECEALFEMDGLQHVVKNTKYPAVIGIGGWNDPRVPVWQPGKFIAALQNANISSKPTVLKINYDNGHFNENKAVTHANFADMYAFVLWQCGHPNFKLQK